MLRKPPRTDKGPKQTVLTGRVTRSRKPASVIADKLPEEDLDSTPGGQETGLPPVQGKPPAWAESRPELCDALPWFRSAQGGYYYNGSLCYGCLLDADSGIRAYVDDEVVITRIGGGCIKDAEGNLVLLKDQDTDSTVLSSVMNSWKWKNPIGLIIGDRNSQLNRKLPHRYNVMAYFRITDVWYERIGTKKGVKVRFEKLDLTEASWWATTGTSHLPIEQRDFALAPETKRCPTCNLESKQVYKEGWMCLTPSCARFWTLKGTAPRGTLTFNEAFLNARLPPDPQIQPHFDLVPDLLGTMREDSGDLIFKRIAWKGIVCPLCSRCIARRFWRGWKCSDELLHPPSKRSHQCSFERYLKISPLSVRSVIEEFEIHPAKRAIYFDPKLQLPHIDDRSLYPYRKLVYNLPGVGTLTHLVANRAINTRANGPDDLFRQLQSVDLGLQRYPLQQSIVRGTLTAHYAVNYGCPYKYVVSVDSKGFNEACDEVLRALGRLTWATQQAVSEAGDQFLAPNELLLLGYMEDMKIGYHDDGESSLGPTIATLSLGARASMLLRMKSKYYHGYTKAKRLLDGDPVLEGCAHHAERRALKDKLDAAAITRAEYDAQRRTLLGNRRGEAPPCIKIELNHGDLVVMHGEKLQKFYEHSVVPEKNLRFALTARYIKPEFVDEADAHKGAFTLTGDQVYDGK
ncbi:uncharacterized protein BO97DRAFT_420902 [Aspergillus homomorphus CBS 101889]|uniref:Alpha-ketoglutarate-dependent dioxygenase AlkB-like domain-containing protein n=1 Tax=Aspergillus homomorphus (strain CBS 101889) TaxID=1450537 RepID=A0A395I983_ASPHC|nr:hypothetical protein BO97DRAFT_420902 [Aspergillus homomorphus CBS 101889]RAL16601.1 hypothetical protein BO97DRAFT_420902 [Aspergillus homomorphus CBS 101889]